MDFIIRNAVSEDCQKIRPLQEEIAMLHHEGRPDLFRTEARYFTQEDFGKRLSDPAHTVLIAEAKNGEVIGYAFAWVISARNHPTYIDFDSYYIDDICVLKAWQGRGVGKALFERCKTDAQHRGCKHLELYVWSFNKNAIAFYEKCGFAEKVKKMEYRLDK